MINRGAIRMVPVLGLVVLLLIYAAQPKTVALRLLGSYFNLSTQFFHGRLPREEQFKAQYGRAYARVLSGPLLQEHIRLMNKASLNSGEFPDFFSEDAGNRIRRVVLTEVNPQIMRGFAVVRDRYVFNFQESRPKLATFVESYAVKGWSQGEFSDMLRIYPVAALKTRREKRYDFEIRRQFFGGRIRKMTGDFLWTRLDRIILENGRELRPEYVLREIRRQNN